MDIRKIKKLIELLEESDLNEIEIKEGEESIRLSRASEPAPPVPAQLAVVDPGTDAYGFELDVCLASGSEELRCAGQPVF